MIFKQLIFAFINNLKIKKMAIEKSTLTPVIMDQSNNKVPTAERAIRSLVSGPTFGGLDMQAFGSVANLGQDLSVRGLPDSVTLICDNSEGTTPLTFVLFDEYGLVEAGRTLGPVTQDGGIYAALKKSTAANPILFKGINYRILEGENNDFRQMKVQDIDIDGSNGPGILIKFAPNKRDDAFSEKIATVQKAFIIDGYKGVEITLPAGQKAAFDFSIAAITRVQ